jgi:hypothetical protein
MSKVRQDAALTSLAPSEPDTAAESIREKTA